METQAQIWVELGTPPKKLPNLAFHEKDSIDIYVIM